MTNEDYEEAVAVLERHLKDTQDALCIHQDEFGPHYADPELVAEWEAVVETVRSRVELVRSCGLCTFCDGAWPLAWLREHDGEERVCPACRGDEVPSWAP